jgi:sulfur transfer complex TusBCD TusB component (DsrH family)
MGKYLVIESRDPFDSSDSNYFSELVQGIAGRGNQTTVLLIQNGVLPARQGSKYNDRIANLVRDDVQVLADGFSLRERAIRNLTDGVQITEIERIVDLLLEPGTKAIWH